VAVLVKISDLRAREIINVVDGTRLGVIKDINIDVEKGKITSLVIAGDNKFMSFFARSEDINIPWEKIHKIGMDVILVELNLYGQSTGEENYRF